MTDRAARAPRLLLVTDRRAIRGRSLVEVVERALTGIAGVAPADVAVQLREKDLDGGPLTELARALRGVTARAGVALYVNDRVDVALAVGADGVQLGTTSVALEDVLDLESRCVIPSHLGVAVSIHGASDLEALAASARRRVAFAVLGPIFDTPSKRRYGPPLGPAALAEASRFGVPLVAVGGVSPPEVASVLAAGATGVACIRAVMGAPAPETAVKAFCQELT